MIPGPPGTAAAWRGHGGSSESGVNLRVSRGPAHQSPSVHSRLCPPPSEGGSPWETAPLGWTSLILFFVGRTDLPAPAVALPTWGRRAKSVPSAPHYLPTGLVRPPLVDEDETQGFRKPLTSWASQPSQHLSGLQGGQGTLMLGARAPQPLAKGVDPPPTGPRDVSEALDSIVFLKRLGVKEEVSSLG